MRADIPKRRVFFCTRNGVKINLYGFYCKDRLPISKNAPFFEKVKQKMPCFFNKLFCVILCIFGSTKRPPAKVPPVAYALSCYFRAIFVCYACVFLLNMNEREQHALRRHPLGQRRVRTAPA